jgi:hypothetical protein
MIDTSLQLFKFAFFLVEVQQVCVNKTGMGPERCQIIKYSRFTDSTHSDLRFCRLCYTCSVQVINYAVLVPANCTDVYE